MRHWPGRSQVLPKFGFVDGVVGTWERKRISNPSCPGTGEGGGHCARCPLWPATTRNVGAKGGNNRNGNTGSEGAALTKVLPAAVKQARNKLFFMLASDDAVVPAACSAGRSGPRGAGSLEHQAGRSSPHDPTFWQAPLAAAEGAGQDRAGQSRRGTEQAGMTPGNRRLSRKKKLKMDLFVIGP